MPISLLLCLPTARLLQCLPLLSLLLCLHPEHISRPCSLYSNGIKLFTECSCNLFPCGQQEQKIAHAFKQQPQSKGRCRNSLPAPQPLRLLPALAVLCGQHWGWTGSARRPRRNLCLIYAVRIAVCSALGPCTLLQWLCISCTSVHRELGNHSDLHSANIVWDHFKKTQQHLFRDHLCLRHQRERLPALQVSLLRHNLIIFAITHQTHKF